MSQYPRAAPSSIEATPCGAYYDIAEFFNGREVETAGQTAPIYGVAEAQRRNAQSYWVFLSHAAAYGKVPGNACFFFSCDDMTPQVNNPGWVAALDDYIKSRDLGAPGAAAVGRVRYPHPVPGRRVRAQHRLGRCRPHVL